MKEFAQSTSTEADFDAFVGMVQKALTISPRIQLVSGAEYRRDAVDSEIAVATHHLWSAFSEGHWRASEKTDVWISGRMDRHPHTGAEFSPRMSILYSLQPTQVLRVSSGTSYRNPNLFDNHVDIRGSVDITQLGLSAALLGDLNTVDFRVVGNTDLEPERMRFIEFAHTGSYLNRLRTHFAVFHYRLDDVYAASDLEVALSDSTTITANTSFTNMGETRGRGLEIGAVFQALPNLDLYGNHSYQKLTGTIDGQASGGGTPHHKTTAGMNWTSGGFKLDAVVHRVGQTSWNRNQVITIRSAFGEVDAYSIVNLRVGYSFSGSLQGWQIEGHAFNLLDNDHFEILPSEGVLTAGQSGEIIRSRRSLRVTYAF